MSSRSCSSSEYSSSVPDLYYIVYTHTSLSCIMQPHRFKDFLSSALYFSTSLFILSRHPRPFKQTLFSSVEKTLLRLLAIMSHSLIFLGRMDITSFARSMSWCSSGHLNEGMADGRSCWSSIFLIYKVRTYDQNISTQALYIARLARAHQTPNIGQV